MRRVESGIGQRIERGQEVGGEDTLVGRFVEGYTAQGRLAPLSAQDILFDLRDLVEAGDISIEEAESVAALMGIIK